MFSYNELKSEVIDIEEESALEKFRERFRSSNHSLAELKSSSTFLKTSILPFVLESEERPPGPTIANLTYYIRGVVFCPFDLDMIPDMLDAISLLESLRKYFIKNVRNAIKDCPKGHSQGGDTQVEGAGDRMLDPDDVNALRKSLAKNKDQRKTYRGIIDRCICLHLVYIWTKSFPHFFAHYESYFPDFFDSPFPSASGPSLLKALHLKDTSAEEMEDYRKTELACRKFMHDAIVFTKSVAFTDMNGETRVNKESYDHPEFLVLVDKLLRGGDVLYETETVENMIETWLQSLEGFVWRLERIFEVELH